jgi:anthranilate 1,2-dioxygenase small subunit
MNRFIDILHEYDAAIEAGDMAAWADLFAPQASYILNSLSNEQRHLPAGLIACFTRAMIDDRAAAIANTTMFEKRIYRILAGRHRLRCALETTHVFAVFQSFSEGPPHVLLTGVATTRFAEDGKITARRTIYDNDLIDTAIIYPV